MGRNEQKVVGKFYVIVLGWCASISEKKTIPEEPPLLTTTRPTSRTTSPPTITPTQSITTGGMERIN
jgi:hypothetical protein